MTDGDELVKVGTGAVLLGGGLYLAKKVFDRDRPRVVYRRRRESGEQHTFAERNALRRQLALAKQRLAQARRRDDQEQVRDEKLIIKDIEQELD